MAADRPVHFCEDLGKGGGGKMEPYLREKLAKEVEHYQNKDFLKAAMAAFVLNVGSRG